MFFNSWQEFWNMGGYGTFVWTAYGITFSTMLIIWLQNRWRMKNLLNKISRNQARSYKTTEKIQN